MQIDSIVGNAMTTRLATTHVDVRIQLQRAATEQLCCLSFLISLIDLREKTTAPPTLSALRPHPILSETNSQSPSDRPGEFRAT